MGKKIIDIGKLSGKVLLFGGVYSNLQALEALIAVAESEGIPPENCICTGDIIGYCAQPEKTLQLFKTWKAKSIVGNVEIQLRQDQEDCGCDFREGSRCDGFSQLWYPYAKSKLSKDSLVYLETLADHMMFNYADRKIAVVHGSFFNVSEFIFKSSAWDLKAKNFEHSKSDIIIAGHCGLPFFDKQENSLWLNPGVIGMPANDGQPSVWYTILDDSTGHVGFKFRQLEYNHQRTSALMKNGVLPEAYANTIVSGIWDNMEILPETERKSQGKPIRL